MSGNLFPPPGVDPRPRPRITLGLGPRPQASLGPRAMGGVAPGSSSAAAAADTPAARRTPSSPTPWHGPCHRNIYIYICIHTCMYICICIYAYVYMHMYICICIYAYVYMHMYICAEICMYLYIYIYGYIQPSALTERAKHSDKLVLSWSYPLNFYTTNNVFSWHRCSWTFLQKCGLARKLPVSQASISRVPAS